MQEAPELADPLLRRRGQPVFGRRSNASTGSRSAPETIDRQPQPPLPVPEAGPNHAGRAAGRRIAERVRLWRPHDGERSTHQGRVEEERAPAPPCPACDCRDLRIRLIPVVQLTFFGPPVVRNLVEYTCALCGEERPDYDPHNWPEEEDDPNEWPDEEDDPDEWSDEPKP